MSQPRIRITSTGGSGDGQKGDPGDSAYQVALNNGFVGTEQQWLDSLIGADGADGADGAQGPQGDPGPAGADGANGADGADGAGVATGGAAGQYLTKVNSTDYNTQWSTLDLTGYQQKVSGVSDTEIGYLDGVTSSIQSQLNTKQGVVGGVSSTEIGYLDGVTSSIQTQINEKAALLSPTITMASFASASSVTDPVTISTANGIGGPGYAGLITLENSGAGVTNPKKYFRLNNVGALEIVNSAYSDTIFYLADNGNLSELGTVNGATIGDTGWQSVSSFSNGFTAPTAVAYRKINNVVYMRGNLNNGTGNATAFTLPVEYRPSVDVVIASQQYGTGNTTYVTVSTNGNVTPNASAAWLSGIIFPVG